LIDNSSGKTNVRQYEDSHYSQIVMSAQRRNIFAGTSNDRSGSIQVLQYNTEGPFLQRL
jgi:hypothetical protein